MLNQIKNLILDMDGVLWRGETPMPGLADFFALLRQKQINFVLATNNASKTLTQYEEKLAKFGVPVQRGQILTSAEATGGYLETQFPPGATMFVVGGDGLREAVSSRGYKLLSIPDVLAGATADAVAVGFSRDVVYDQFAAGALLIRRGAAFVGTNPDASFPSEHGQLPGAGSFLALVETGTGVKPTVIGKPGPLLFQDALRRLGGNPTDTAMVGDRLETDIAGGKAAGIGTILVLSGISTREQAENSADLRPDLIFSDITEIGKQL